MTSVCIESCQYNMRSLDDLVPIYNVHQLSCGVFFRFKHYTNEMHVYT